MASEIGVQTIQHTNGTDAMTIDSSGRVSRPVIPSFLVGLSASYSHSNAALLQYNTISDGGHNTGGHFSLTNYKFTAPLAGTYYFFARASIATGEKTRRADVKMKKNNSNVNTSFAARFNLDGTNTGGSSYLGLGGSWVIELAANDTIAFELNWETDGTFDATESVFYHGTYACGYFIG